MSKTKCLTFHIKVCKPWGQLNTPRSGHLRYWNWMLYIHSGVLLTDALPGLGFCADIRGFLGAWLFLHSIPDALASAFCLSSASVGLRNCLFPLTVLSPDCMTHDLSESFSMQVPCFHEWSQRKDAIRTSCPISSSGNCFIARSW